jgi:hypothetical protein
MPHIAQIVVVPEDNEHSSLARGYLEARGVGSNRYHVTKRWTGKNGNFDRVRDWFAEEVRFQAKRLVRFGIIAMIDEDGQGLTTRQELIADELERLDLPSLAVSEGRVLVIPVRNIETWMVWGARWASAGRPTSRALPKVFPGVDETHDYKRWRSRAGQSLTREARLDAFLLGQAIATLNPVDPPTGLPPSLHDILRPWSEFLEWARR